MSIRNQRTTPPYINLPVDRWKLLVLTLCTLALLLGAVYLQRG